MKSKFEALFGLNFEQPQTDVGPIFMTNANSNRFLRLYQLINETKSEASLQHLPDIENLANIALLQLVVDWEGIDPLKVSERELASIMQRKEALARDQTLLSKEIQY